MENSYFEWLCDRVGVYGRTSDREQPKTYYLLLKELHAIPFVWIIDLDSNRADDALSLRDEYILCVKHHFHDYTETNCTVLETLLSIAIRMNFELETVDSRDDRTSMYFWEMIHNLGLDEFDDDEYDGAEVFDIVSMWLDRTYREDGTGGIFPLRYPDCDQRDLELWYQMQAYIEENYAY